MPLPLICSICGGTGRGFHFGGLPSCESCRAFFTRNASNRGNLICRSNSNNCPISHTVHRMCNKCRIERCFQMGLTPRPPPSGSSLLHCALDPTTPGGATAASMEDPPFLTQTARPLGSFERHCIEHICTSLRSFFPEEANLSLSAEPQTLDSILNRPAVYMHKLLQYLMRIPYFQELTYQQKRSVLKGSSDLFTAVRYAFQYNSEMDGFILFDTNEAQTICIRKYLYADLLEEEDYEMTVEIMENFSREMFNDRTTRDLLIAVILSGQLFECIGDGGMRCFYLTKCLLLKRYLQEKLNDEYRASEKYYRLLYGLYNQLPLVIELYYESIRRHHQHLTDRTFRELIDEEETGSDGSNGQQHSNVANPLGEGTSRQNNI